MSPRLLRGGQGRSAGDVRRDAEVLRELARAAFVLLATAWYLALLLSGGRL